MKSIVILFSLFASLVGTQAFAFDRMQCNSDLKNWSVHNKPEKDAVILNSSAPSVLFSRDKSENLIFKNEMGNEIATILPWDGVVLLKEKSAEKIGYEFKLNEDGSTWFSVEILDPKSKTFRSLMCHFTF